MAQLKDEMSKGAISAQDVSDAFEIATSKGGTFYKGMDEASKTTSGALSTLKDNAKTLIGEVFEPLSKSILENVLPTATGYIDQLSKAFKEKGVTGLVEATGEILGKIISKIAESAPQLINSAFLLIQNLVSGIQQNLPTIVQSAITIVVSLVNGILDMLPQILQMGIDIIIQLCNGLSQELPTLIPKAVETIMTLVEGLLDNVDKLVDAALQLVQGLADGIIKALPILVEKMPVIIDKACKALSNNLPKILEMGINLIIQLAAGLIKALPQLLANIPKIMGSVISGFATYYKKLGEIGLNLIKGLWGGISDAGAWLRDKISGFFGGVVDNIKKFFGIHSPSTLFASLGTFMSQGLGIGFTKEMSSVSKDMTKAIPSSFDVDVGANINKRFTGSKTALQQAIAGQGYYNSTNSQTNSQASIVIQAGDFIVNGNPDSVTLKEWKKYKSEFVNEVGRVLTKQYFNSGGKLNVKTMA